METYISKVDHVKGMVDNEEALGQEAMQLLDSHCTLCDEATGSKKFLKAVFGKNLNRTILDLPSALIVPSLGQIVADYLLVFPKTHIPSWASLAEAEFSNFEKAIIQAETLLRKVYEHYVLFEHGMDQAGVEKGCGITHAHVHLVPGKASLNSALKALRATRIDCFQDIRQYADSAYVLVKNEEGLFIAANPNIESQYLRKQIAFELGVIERWSWKEYIGRDAVVRTRDHMLSNLLETNKEDDVAYSEKFIKIAEQAAKNSTCDIRAVGSVLVKNGEVLAHGWNSAPSGLSTCDEAGHLWKDGHCIRTIHAEAMCIANAARNGLSTEDTDLFVTAFPCYSCLKLVAQAGVRKVFCYPYTVDPMTIDAAKLLGIGLYRVE